MNVVRGGVECEPLSAPALLTFASECCNLTA